MAEDISTDSTDSTEQKIALITGGNKGIGYETAAQLAAVGMTVVLGSRDTAQGEEAAERLRGSGADAHTVLLDVTDTSTVAAAAAYLESTFNRLDVLVNNAGVSGEVTQQIPSGADIGLVRAVFETNYFGVLAVTNAMIPLLRRSPRPRIVNVTSGLGSLTAMSDPNSYLVNIPGSAAYAPSKTALNSLTVQYAKELRKDGFLVNAADPGPCDTDFTKSQGFSVERGADRGAAVVVKLATLDSDGPTGGYFSEAGVVPW